MRRLFLRAAGATAVGALLQACGGGGGGSNDVPAGPNSLLALLQQDSSLSLFASAVSRAGLTGRYGGATTNLTLFAADNAAMDTLGQRLGFGDGSGLIGGLSSGQWAAILNFSTLGQVLSRGALDAIARRGVVDERPPTLHSFEGRVQPLIFEAENGNYTIWDGIGRTSITYSRTDLGASNGVLHVLTAPVLPRGVLTVAQMLRANTDAFGDFADRMVAAGLSAQLDGSGPFTVFAPGYVSVPALDAAGVRRHVTLNGGNRLDESDFFAQGSTRAMTSLAGTSLTLRSASPYPTVSSNIATAQVVDVDFWGSNGVIHTINGVL